MQTRQFGTPLWLPGDPVWRIASDTADLVRLEDGDDGLIAVMDVGSVRVEGVSGRGPELAIGLYRARGAQAVIVPNAAVPIVLGRPAVPVDIPPAVAPGQSLITATGASILVDAGTSRWRFLSIPDQGAAGIIVLVRAPLDRFDDAWASALPLIEQMQLRLPNCIPAAPIPIDEQLASASIGDVALIFSYAGRWQSDADPSNGANLLPRGARGRLTAIAHAAAGVVAADGVISPWPADIAAWMRDRAAFGDIASDAVRIGGFDGTWAMATSGMDGEPVFAAGDTRIGPSEQPEDWIVLDLPDARPPNTDVPPGLVLVLHVPSDELPGLMREGLCSMLGSLALQYEPGS